MKKQFIKIKHQKTGNWYITRIKDFMNIIDEMLDEDVENEVYEICVVHLTEEEYNNLSEFEGF